MRNKRKAYQVIKSRYVTEKTQVMQSLEQATSNKSLSKCQTPKYTFLVDRHANKAEIAAAIEEIYSSQEIKVRSVNTINVKPKKRRVRGRQGFKPSFKKAIVSLQPGDSIEEAV